MNCADWEERIALGEPAGEVQRHLNECAGCREFAHGLRESLAWLQEAHADEPDAANYTAVRSRVLAELERQRVPVWRRAWVYGLAAAGLSLVALAGWRFSEQPVEPLPMAALKPPGAPAVARSAPRKPLAARPPVKLAQAEGEPLLIKIETNDPDIVIYWIAETRGDD